MTSGVCCLAARAANFERKELTMYRRFLVLAIGAGYALAASNAVAAPERVRGTIAGVSGDALSVDTAARQTVPVTLTDRTRYLKVAPSIMSIPVPISARQQNPFGIS